jgi:hypothetical protein
LHCIVPSRLSINRLVLIARLLPTRKLRFAYTPPHTDQTISTAEWFQINEISLRNAKQLPPYLNTVLIHMSTIHCTNHLSYHYHPPPCTSRPTNQAIENQRISTPDSVSIYDIDMHSTIPQQVYCERLAFVRFLSKWFLAQETVMAGKPKNDVCVQTTEPLLVRRRGAGMCELRVI